MNNNCQFLLVVFAQCSKADGQLNVIILLRDSLNTLNTMQIQNRSNSDQCQSFICSKQFEFSELLRNACSSYRDRKRDVELCILCVPKYVTKLSITVHIDKYVKCILVQQLIVYGSIKVSLIQSFCIRTFSLTCCLCFIFIIHIIIEKQLLRLQIDLYISAVYTKSFQSGSSQLIHFTNELKIS